MVKKLQLIEKLRAFEKRIGDRFNSKEIKAPIHLYDGNEEKMVDVFNYINTEDDWVCCTWRNHYQALLKGIPEDYLESEIIKGKSMVMTLPEYKFICSSIVGGIPSIAAGIAMGIKLENKRDFRRVWCWVGDMSAETGHFHEAYKFARNYELPITFIVENNNISVLTPTDEVWNREIPWYIDDVDQFEHDMNNLNMYKQPNLWFYEYKNGLYPHAGAGQRVQF